MTILFAVFLFAFAVTILVSAFRLVKNNPEAFGAGTGTLDSEPMMVPAYPPEIFEPEYGNTGIVLMPAVVPPPTMTVAEETAPTAYEQIAGKKVRFRTNAGNWLTARVVGQSAGGFNLRRHHHEFRKPAEAIRLRPITTVASVSKTFATAA